MAKYLDQAGLSILWAKIKGLIPEGDVVTDTELTEILSNYVTTSQLNSTVEELEQKIEESAGKIFTFKGSVPTYAELPSSDIAIGDVYNIETADPEHGIQAGDNVVWTGDGWSKLGGSIDLSNYATKTYVDEGLAKKVTQTIEGTNGTSLVWNEVTGGGAKFTHNDGTESFVGVNDGGANGMVAQIYADKQVDGNWIGSRLNVYQKGMFYHNAEDKAGDSYVADDPLHEIATIGDIPESEVYYLKNICALTTGAGASQIEAAIGSWDKLYNAIINNKTIVDTDVQKAGEVSWSNPRPAVNASAQNNVVIHLSFHMTSKRVISCEIQNVSGLAIAVDDIMLNDAEALTEEEILEILV